MASGTDANPEVTLASLESARATLGIPSFASRDEARRAYRALARAFHPDKGGDVNRFREVRKAHERLEAAWNASAVRRSRDESAADDPTVASPETKRDDGSPPATAEPNPVAPTRDLEALAAEALDAGDFERARDVLDAVIARALADESEGRESLSASPERQKKKKTGTAGTLAEAFFSRARACAGAGDWPAALLDADGALARRGLWFEPHVVRAQALERLGRHREAEESYALYALRANEGDSESDDDEDASSAAFSFSDSSYDSSEESDDADDDDDDDDDDDGTTGRDGDDGGNDGGRINRAASTRDAFDDFLVCKKREESVRSRAATTDDETKTKTKTVASPRAIASEGSRRCRAAAARRTSVFETRDASGAGIVAVAFAPHHETEACGGARDKSSLSCETLLAAADALGAVSIWSVPSGRRAFRLEASGASRRALDENQTLPSIDQVSIKSSSTSSSIASLGWGPVFGDGELRLVATTERGDATLWRFAVRGLDSDSDSDADDSQSPESHHERRCHSALRLVATHSLVARVAEEDTLRKRGPAVAAFAPGAALVGVGDAAGRLRVFDARDGTLRRTSRRAHAGAVTCVAFHPQRSWQATTGGADGDGRAWDLDGAAGGKPGRCQHTFRWHQHTEGARSRTSVTDVAYAPCGRLVVLATADHLGNSGAGSYRVLVWSAATGRLCTWHDAHAAPVTSFAWEQRFASFTENAGDAAEADAATLARERRRRRALEENVVVTACEDGALRLWALRGAPQGAGKPLHECWAYAAGTSMSLQSRSGRGNVASRDDWRRGGLGGPPVARGAASCVARSPGGGGLLATAHVDGTVRVLDASSFRVVEAWSLGAAQRACAWAPLGFGEGLGEFSETDTHAHVTTTAHMLASGGCDGTVRVWRVELDARLDAVSWRDPDEGVVAAIGPGDAGRGKALPASTLVGVSGERVSLALEAFGGENSTKARYGGMATSDATPNAPFSMFDHRTRAAATRALPAAGDGTLAVSVADGARNDAYACRLKPEDTRGLPVDALAFAFGDAAAAAAERRVAAWRVALAESESATRAASAARRADVRHRFPRMTPSQRRAYNAAYAERMAPLRARRARFWNLVQSHGYGTEKGETNASEPNETSERETEL